MNDDQNFSDLRRLLALKRHEAPPPGYFNRLPGRILSRIEAAEPSAQSTWWDWLVARFDARPILACAYGFTISGLLLMGFRLSEVLKVDADSESTPNLGGGWLAVAPDALTAQPSPFVQSHFANPAHFVNFSSVEPVVELSTPRPSSRMFMPVSYSVSK